MHENSKNTIGFYTIYFCWFFKNEPDAHHSTSTRLVQIIFKESLRV
jgi:hypothetical protein